MLGKDPILTENEPDAQFASFVEAAKENINFDARLAEYCVRKCVVRGQISRASSAEATEIIASAISEHINPFIVLVLFTKHNRAGHLYNRRIARGSPAMPDDLTDSLIRELVRVVADHEGPDVKDRWVRSKVTGIRTIVSYKIEDIWRVLAA
ncbi:hypothetical protein [Maricaulis sp. W15]|uniref:hypothetical protein n=1 Tax=Maricaulis sp. W15 TaxID=1772333 RepID=UPI00117D68CD|nr:hypothetical protein [Maricaulis sp. W15]